VPHLARRMLLALDTVMMGCIQSMSIGNKEGNLVS
jgi:hypothetical protein